MTSASQVRRSAWTNGPASAGGLASPVRRPPARPGTQHVESARSFSGSSFQCAEDSVDEQLARCNSRDYADPGDVGTPDSNRVFLGGDQNRPAAVREGTQLLNLLRRIEMMVGVSPALNHIGTKSPAHSEELLVISEAGKHDDPGTSQSL